MALQSRRVLNNQNDIAETKQASLKRAGLLFLRAIGINICWSWRVTRADALATLMDYILSPDKRQVDRFDYWSTKHDNIQGELLAA